MKIVSILHLLGMICISWISTFLLISMSHWYICRICNLLYCKNLHFSVLWFLVALNFFCIGVLLTNLTYTLSHAATTRLTYGLTLAALNFFSRFARILVELLRELSISSLQKVHQVLLEKNGKFEDA